MPGVPGPFRRGEIDRQTQELKTKGFSEKMKIKTERRCGCRDADGKQLGKRCPKLKRKDHGRWTYRIQVPEDLRPLVGRGEIRGSGYPAEEDARADAEKEVVKIRSGRQHVGQLTVGQYLNTWLAGKRRLRPTSRGGYESNIRLYLCPMLGELPLKGLRKSHIHQMIARLEVEGSAPVKGGNGAIRKSRPLAPKTILEIFATLRAALNDAVVERLIDGIRLWVWRCLNKTRRRLNRGSPRRSADSWTRPLTTAWPPCTS
ncbi:hypothetical protein [Frankia sp. ACN10a]|uniref:hypothetical protein n=1 Tax=Frankia sp. ACN10a TaxID=2926031 RepID=UPI0027413F84|nr:hypothetical protein [Frankia sp. ACN10a]